MVLRFWIRRTQDSVPQLHLPWSYWAAKPPLASSNSVVVAQWGVMLTMGTALGGCVCQRENLGKHARIDNRSVGGVTQTKAKIPVLDPFNKSLLRMLTLEPQTRPGCPLEQILLQDLLFWGRRSWQTGMGTLRTGGAYFPGPLLAAHMGRIKEKIRKISFLIWEKKKNLQKCCFF